MTLADLASIGSLVSGLAVLISLGYLSLQVRQTERNQRALMNQGAMARDTDIVAMLGQPEFVDAWTRAMAGETEFTAAEVWQLSLKLRALLGSLQDTHLQRKTGLIDQITYDYVAGGVQYFVAQPVIQALWTNAHEAYPPEMIAIVDGFIAKAPPAAPVDFPAALKAQLAKAPS
jgi:hypothetical protein